MHAEHNAKHYQYAMLKSERRKEEEKLCCMREEITASQQAIRQKLLPVRKRNFVKSSIKFNISKPLCNSTSTKYYSSNTIEYTHLHVCT